MSGRGGGEHGVAGEGEDDSGERLGVREATRAEAVGEETERTAAAGRKTGGGRRRRVRASVAREGTGGEEMRRRWMGHVANF